MPRHRALFSLGLRGGSGRTAHSTCFQPAHFKKVGQKQPTSKQLPSAQLHPHSTVGGRGRGARSSARHGSKSAEQEGERCRLPQQATACNWQHNVVAVAVLVQKTRRGEGQAGEAAAAASKPMGAAAVNARCRLQDLLVCFIISTSRV